MDPRSILLLYRGGKLLKDNCVRFIRRHFWPQRYRFKVVAPKVFDGYQHLKYEDWKSARNYRKEMNMAFYLAMFVIGFSISDFLTQLKENPVTSYYFYIRYPVTLKLIDSLCKDFEQALSVLDRILPRNEQEVGLTFTLLWQFIWNTRERTIEKDKQVIKLQQQLKLLDEAIPYLK